MAKINRPRKACDNFFLSIFCGILFIAGSTKKTDVATVSSMTKPQCLKPFYTGYNIELATTITAMLLSALSSKLSFLHWVRPFEISMTIALIKKADSFF